MKNLKTPIEQILFRSSKIYQIASGVVSAGITADQQKELDEYERMLNKPQGLTPTQQGTYNKYKNKLDSGGTLSTSQKEVFDDYSLRLVTPKGLSEKQEEKRKKYIAKKSQPYKLTAGAKAYVRELWDKYNRGFDEEIQTNIMLKGIIGEEGGITLISIVDGVLYVNNNEKENNGRITKNNITGACDVVTEFKELELIHDPINGYWYYDNENENKKYFFRDVRVIDDIKCSWNLRTFRSAKLTTQYEWQGRAYMYLYDADIFRLRHCLLDCPEEVLEDEYIKFRNMHKLTARHIVDNELLEQIDQGQISEEFINERPEHLRKEYKEIKRKVEQFFSNYLPEQTGLFTDEERVKTFSLQRDYKQEEKMIIGVELAKEYWDCITVNMIE